MARVTPPSGDRWVSRGARVLWRVRCSFGIHTPLGSFHPTGKNAPAYEWQIRCLWCDVRFR